MAKWKSTATVLQWHYCLLPSSPVTLMQWQEDLLPPAAPVGEGNGIPLQYSCLENPMDKPRQVSVVDLTVCVAERRVHECLNMALVNTTVDRAGGACAVGWCIRLKLAWCLKTNTTFMLLQRHSGLPCLHPPLAVSVSSPDRKSVV